MKHETAASAVPALQEALGKVLQSTSMIAQVSAHEFEAYWELLAPTRLGIYELLQAIYSEHADLDPLADIGPRGQTGPSNEPAESTQETPEAKRSLDADTSRRARRILEEAHGLVGQGEAVMTTGSEIETPELARFRVLCFEALLGIESALRLLVTVPKGSQ